jgi:acyl transferase domain-containing protein/acyl carrier protein
MNTTTQRLAEMSSLQLALAARQLESKRPILDAEPLAIVGIGCRLPGAKNPDEFWRLLMEGRDANVEVPADRWDIDAFYDPDPAAPGKMYTRRAGFLDRIDAFDPQFFGISPREARTMDPQQRLLLEVSWEALENASLPLARLSGSPTGVFIGMCTYDFGYSLNHMVRTEDVDLYYSTGISPSVAAGRLSYTLGLTGPCMTIDTACSSSLVAIHQASSSLRARECDMALAGGVSLMASPELTIAFCRAGMLSPDGRCRTFDQAAEGYGRGEGCGIIVLKRLADAMADGDDVVAVLRGSAVNQDGPSGGLTVPSGPAQQAVMRRALQSAGALASQVHYIECHGTATRLGDPVEVNAIGAVLGRDRTRESNPLFMGSVKTNIGHLEAAAGIAGVIKVALAVRNGVIPAHLHFDNPSPLIDWQSLPCVVPTENTPWPAGRRMAGVSSFGYSGTNAHVLLEAAPVADAVELAEVDRPRHLLTLSAKNADALAESARAYAAYLDGQPQASLADICHTAAVGRAHFNHRLAIHASSSAELRERLAHVSVDPRATANQEPAVAFVFPGEPRIPGLGRELYDTHEQFRGTVDRCAAILQCDGKALLDEVDGAASFTLQYALAELWRSWGVAPLAVWGAGVGERVAACVSDASRLEDFLRGARALAFSDLARTLPSEATIEKLRGEGCGVLLDVSLAAGRGEWEQLLDKVAELYTRGVPLDWEEFDRVYPRRRVALPTYPFQRQRYWPGDDRKRRRAAPHAEDPLQHPLLGARLHSAALDPGRIVFESRLSSESPAYLTDHRVFGHPVLPAAAFIEIALAAGAAVFDRSALVLEDVAILQPLLLPDGEECVVQTVLDADEFRIFSRSHDAEWTLHASGKVRPAAESKPSAWRDGASMSDVSIDALYGGFAEHGLDYGPAFRALAEVRRNGSETTGRVVLPAHAGHDPYLLHPVLLDASFHAFGPLFNGRSDTYLPTGFERIRFYRPPSGTVLCRASLEGSDRVLSGAVGIFDESGEAIAELEGIAIQRASRDAVLRKFNDVPGDWFYEVAWRPKANEGAIRDGSRGWLIADANGFGAELAQALEQTGDRPTVVAPGAVRRLIEAAGPSFDGCIYVAGHDAFEACAEALEIVQALADAGGGRLWILTRGAQQVANEPEAVDAHQASLWGLARVVAAEGVGVTAMRVDLDPAAESRDQQVAHVLGELNASDGEDQVAYRNGARSVARLVRRAAAALPDGPVRLSIADAGTFESLRLTSLQRRTPAAGEIEIEVRASGLNFRDVLHALGMLPKTANGSELLFGFECAGVVTAVGAGVTSLAAGQEVVALTRGAMGSYVMSLADHAAPKPSALSFEEAAAIPLVYLTALYGLEKLAGIRRGDRVLIHAAAGGVGQAALQIALRAGAEVFATASRGKWPRLAAQGVRHVMDSRSVDFADELLRVTDGAGVDVVLNSFNGDFIPQSLRCLGPGGRFVELGKIGIWSEEQLRAERPDVSYFPFDLGEVAAADPALIAAMLRELSEALDTGALAKLPIEVFPLHEAATAFRHVAQAKHFGKVVLTCARRMVVRSDATYLITGGLGALGLEVARWMVAEGARRLVLASREEGSPEAVAELRALGAEVIPIAADVCRPADVARMLEAAQVESHPLRGVIHAAGVLDDCAVMELDAERLRRVLAPKADGAWQLHLQTRDLPLDFFVCFSSLSSLIGTPGQAAYAAANSFMDALAHYRRAQRLPTLTVNWGPWSGVGMAARMGEQYRDRIAQRGFLTIDPVKGVRSLGELLRQNAVQTAVFPAKWERVLQDFPAGGEPPFYAELAGEARRVKRKPDGAKAPGGGFAAKLAGAPAAAHRDLVIQFLQEQLRTILGVSGNGQLDLDQPLSDMGLDSLMGIELKSRVGTELGVNIPLRKFASAATLEGLAALLLEESSLATIAVPGTGTAGEGIEEIAL